MVYCMILMTVQDEAHVVFMAIGLNPINAINIKTIMKKTLV